MLTFDRIFYKIKNGSNSQIHLVQLPFWFPQYELVWEIYIMAEGLKNAKFGTPMLVPGACE